MKNISKKKVLSEYSFVNVAIFISIGADLMPIMPLIVLSLLDNNRDHFRNLKEPRISIGWPLWSPVELLPAVYLDPSQVECRAYSGVSRKVRGPCALLIAPFLKPLFYLHRTLFLSFFLANFRECRRLSLITIAVAPAVSFSPVRFRIYVHTRLIADYRVYQSACFAKLRCYRWNFARSSN